MKRLFLTRERFGDSYTIGTLKTPFQTFYTLEDKVREVEGEPVEQWKVKGETAIPCGTYSLVLDESARFKRVMPHILDVPGFTGIRIHAGNTSHDTEGCVLLGWAQDKDAGMILQSRVAVEDFMSEMQNYFDNGEEVEITIA